MHHFGCVAHFAVFDLWDLDRFDYFEATRTAFLPEVFSRHSPLPNADPETISEKRLLVLHVMLAALLTSSAPLADESIPFGSAEVEVTVAQQRLRLFTYKSPTYQDGPLIVVFHGMARNADDYRDHARTLANRQHALVVAPEFDQQRFPSSRYNHGGLKQDDAVVARQEWTWSLIEMLAEEIRRREERPQMPYYLIGHSAGGQFVGRMAGFVECSAQRFVAANPSAYLWPSRQLPFPYGFGKLPDELSNDVAIQKYLAQPLTILVGTADDQRDNWLDTCDHADWQGTCRLDRGRRVYAAGKELAEKKQWPFHWKLVEVPGVGHDGAAILAHLACEEALFGGSVPVPTTTNVYNERSLAPETMK